MPTFSFRIDDLPLIRTAAGFSAAPVCGYAEIRYTRQADWAVIGVSLDGSRARTGAELTADKAAGRRVQLFEDAQVELAPDSWLFQAIKAELESAHYSSFIDDEVVTQLREAA